MPIDDCVYLNGVSLSNYRGIGSDIQFISPFGRFNFFIGPNNSGKSCVLNYIANHLKSFVMDFNGVGERPKLDQLSVRQGSNGTVHMGVGVSVDFVRYRFEEAFGEQFENKNLASFLDAIVDFISKGEVVWLNRSPEWNMNFTFCPPDVAQCMKVGEAVQWQRLWVSLFQRSGGDPQYWVREVLTRLVNSIIPSLPQTSLIPAIRQISKKGELFNAWDGRGLIDELVRHQNPGFDERHKRQIFEKINLFLQTVIEKNDARIEIPHNLEYVLVHADGKVLPLDALGTGIHEVVMLAAFCTLMEKQIVCIEEPEIHLHPLLQRRLIQYLEENTENQYFIATHSSSIIDTPGAAVFHVRNVNGETKVQAALTPNMKFEICRDLGYRASDILQANAIVWVEGPSDRIYIKHWIHSLAPELREGIDYSIMFYGGRLLSHLSADDEAGDEGYDIEALIALRTLNRHLAVVIDSDKDRHDASIRATKLRIEAEISEHGGIAWITEGREIENYVSEQMMAGALKRVYPQFERQVGVGQYDHTLPFETTDGKTKTDNIDKVRVAKAVCESPANLGVLDLEKRIMSLVEMIRRANR